MTREGIVVRVDTETAVEHSSKMSKRNPLDLKQPSLGISRDQIPADTLLYPVLSEPSCAGLDLTAKVSVPVKPWQKPTGFPPHA